MSILDALNPVSALVSTARGLIAQFVPDPQKRLELEQVIATQSTAIEQQVLAASQASITTEEQGNWLQRAWRPLVSLGLFGLIFYAGAIVSIFHLPQIDMSGVPPQLWSTFQMCVGGYMGLRSGEKVVSGITGYLKTKNGS